MPLREAIVEACRTRLRPILMTTSAIVAGLIPTALGLGIGGQGRAAIAVTIIGGQSLCLFLTLLLVPVAYVKLDALEQSVLNQGWKGLLARFKTPAGLRLRITSPIAPTSLAALMADGKRSMVNGRDRLAAPSSGRF